MGLVRLDHLGRERQRWFVYATFGHSAASLDSPVTPAEDERDNISNVTPHAQYLGNALYEYLPGLSRGTGEPKPTARLEFPTVELVPGRKRPLRRPSARTNQSCKGRRSGIGCIAGELSALCPAASAGNIVGDSCWRE